MFTTRSTHKRGQFQLPQEKVSAQLPQEMVEDQLPRAKTYLQSQKNLPDQLPREEILNHLPGDDPRVVAALRNSFIDPPSTLPCTAKIKRGRTELIYSHIQQMFSTEQNGFFIEAGALDGEFLSTSLWLEKVQGWTGLLVEPGPGVYQQLLRRHRKAWSTNTCLSPQNFTNYMNFVNTRDPKNRLFSVTGSSFLEGIRRSAKFENWLRKTRAQRTVTKVACFPFVSYLLALNVSKVDFLSLDTQGSEVAILKTIPLKTLKIRVIVVEVEAPMV